VPQPGPPGKQLVGLGADQADAVAVLVGDLAAGVDDQQLGVVVGELELLDGEHAVDADATGKAFVYDARTGADLASYQLAAPGAATFVNDVVVTSKAAWFTDSSAAQLYALPLGRHGRLPGQDKVRTLPPDR
jgi:hypothetical protein